MFYSSVVLLLPYLMPLATAAPATSHDLTQRSPDDIQLKDGTSLVVTDSSPDKRSPQDLKLKDGTVVSISDSTPDRKAKRSPEIIVLRDGSNVTISDIEDDETTEDDLVKRKSNYISSCGPESGWIPVNDHYSGGTGTKWWGYTSTVSEYCQRISYDLNGNPLILQPHKKSSYTVRYQNDASNSGIRVALKGEVPGHFEFEINNKSGSEHRVDEDSCKEYLMEMAATNCKCYGSINKDTKGGTWQVGDSQISYHALPAAN